MRKIGIPVVVVGIAVLGVICCASDRRAVYLVPDGYVGPVVIVFEDSHGAEPRRGRFATEYDIPPSGVLRLSTEGPTSRFRKHDYVHLSESGARREFPSGAEISQHDLQVFGYIAGIFHPGPSPAPGTRYHAFIVGVPSQQDDWFYIRKAAIEGAVRGDRVD